MKPSVHVFTLDCLRASTCTERITPFLHTLPLQWTRCYSSGTWTLPSHASLFSGQCPINHGVTRSSDTLSKGDANLPKTAQENGYTTAIFSENPTFSSSMGFNHYIDVPNDDIHRKLLPSEFSPVKSVEEISVNEAVSLATEVITRPNRLRNTVNAAYATYRELFNQDPSYPHHGERIFNHLKSFTSQRTAPMLTVTNVLDPHNPYHDTPPEMKESRPQPELEALRAGDDNRIYLLTSEDPPEGVSSIYDGWESFFHAQESIYEEYAQEADRLLQEWHNAQTNRFKEDLVVILGDHGQLFGAEEMVGHHTSLHPHGINVPLAIDPPHNWKTPTKAIDTPVSTAGVGCALMNVIAGEIETTKELVNNISYYSQDSNGAVIACADGPTWSIPALHEDDRFDDSLIDKLAVRKVAYIRDERVDIYRSPWDTETIESTSFTYTQDARNSVPERDTPPITDDAEEWLVQMYNPENEQRNTVDARLEALGYV
ncbi:sulfatase-like hydrolase/transferase [Haloarcula argentinensis]|uniref:Sulfatase-like hydrolase/transferase n=1 Tax=Haloarcula argentinensis TaxID=43776 RepID=A0ABU2EZ14_HALAR|nr:sulfatase-like hydrolase/transferase [Haloarcula argentinensis]EMA24367.1 arylsulfatase [Haloarcula argentinensis DSM 12282]MDS0253517.1 sulfatase-like hydrolase/transferase [Haloarcula argentinensis]